MATRNYKSGFAVTDTPGDLVCLRAEVTANTKSSFRDAAGQYQVPVGKTLYITKIQFFTTAATQSVRLGYGDDAVENSAADPTTPKNVTSLITSLAANTEYELEVFVPVPASKYPLLVVSAASGYMTAYGIVV